MTAKLPEADCGSVQDAVVVVPLLVSGQSTPPTEIREIGARQSVVVTCVVRDANMGHQIEGGHSSWCPELESRTAHRQHLPRLVPNRRREGQRAPVSVPLERP